MKKYVKCCYKGCSEQANPEVTEIVSWGDYVFCPEHDQVVFDSYNSCMDIFWRSIVLNDDEAYVD